MKKSSLSKYYLFISLATFLAIMFVIIQKSYSNLMGPVNSVKASNLIKPISTSLSLEIIDSIESKKEYPDMDINSNIWRNPNITSTPTPIPTLATLLTPTP